MIPQHLPKQNLKILNPLSIPQKSPPKKTVPPNIGPRKTAPSTIGPGKKQHPKNGSGQIDPTKNRPREFGPPKNRPRDIGPNKSLWTKDDYPGILDPLSIFDHNRVSAARASINGHLPVLPLKGSPKMGPKKWVPENGSRKNGSTKRVPETGPNKKDTFFARAARVRTAQRIPEKSTFKKT